MNRPQPDGALRRYARRSLTVPLYLTGTALATLLLPILVPVCWLVSLQRARRGTLRSILFIVCYLWCESIGIAVSLWLWLRHGCPTRHSQRWAAFLAGNFTLQCRWANALKMAAQTLFDLRFSLSGEAALNGAPAIMLPRHASIADTVIPMVFYAIPQRIRLRYVLKRELLMDPCLDIVGNRLPNYFVARSGDPRDIAGLTALARDRGDDEGLLIYPEGTRFTPARRERIVANRAARVAPDELQMIQRWVDLLPPRLSGTRALITTASDLDLLFCAHVGFENASHFRTLINGSWIGADVRIHFWRIAAADVPRSEPELQAFLFAQWDRMQETVTQLKAR